MLSNFRGAATAQCLGLTGNCLFALLMLTVLRHVGMPVFLTILSRAQAFRTGSALMSSYTCLVPSQEAERLPALVQSRLTATVISKLVPSTCRMWVMAPDSCAWNFLTTFQPFPIILTFPSYDPRNRLSDPVQRLETSLLSNSWRVSSSGEVTWETSKKSNDFHFAAISELQGERHG